MQLQSITNEQLVTILKESLTVDYFYRSNFIALNIFEKPVLTVGFLIKNPLVLLQSLKEQEVRIELLEKNMKQTGANGTLLNQIALINQEFVVEIQRKDGGDQYYLNAIHPIDSDIEDMPSLRKLGNLVRQFE